MEKVDDHGMNLLVHEVILSLKVEQLENKNYFVDVEHDSVQNLLHEGFVGDCCT